MSVDRPTFSESWHRVADLRPRLRAGVRVYRQQFRGETWRVMQDPAGETYHRINEAAHRFIGLLDGARTVGEAWSLAVQRHGDEAPTQGEAIRLLGQLYTSNLLHAELPGDAEAMFRRYRKRKGRELKGTLTNFLFFKIPLVDPDRFLERWTPLLGMAFMRTGLIAWGVLVALGVAALASRGRDFVERAPNALDQANLIWMYVAFVLAKLLHELGHGVSCKKFGKQEGAGGEVHQMGVILAVLMPAPYVDASSAWALRSKWRRIVIGAAGMYVELAVAAVAAMVWAATGETGVVNAIAYNVVFIAGVSTLVFNANPLMRYDGYYMLSDLVESPNLQQRSGQQIAYLVKRFAWRVRRAVSPARSDREGWLLVAYGIASTVYRLTVVAAIIWFVSQQWFVIGAIAAIAAGSFMVISPVSRLMRYLASSPELMRVRRRAAWTTVATAAAVLFFVGLVPVPDRVRINGVVTPARAAEVFIGADGFIERMAPSGTRPEDPFAVRGVVIASAENVAIDSEMRGLDAEVAQAEGRRRSAMGVDPALVAVEEERIAALRERLADAHRRKDALQVKSPFDGVWVSPEADRMAGSYVKQGTRLGEVVSTDELVIRAVAGQGVAARLFRESPRAVEIKVRGRPEVETRGTAERPRPAAVRDLPSVALGVEAGGEEVTNETPEGKTEAAEQFFEVRVTPEDDSKLFAGQRVVVRVTLPSRSILSQVTRAIGRALQERLSFDA